VDDGSTDATPRIACDRGALVISHPRNYGVGRAFQTGLDAALQNRADIMVNIDADGQFNADDIPLLVEPLLEGRADFVTGSRFLDPALVPAMPGVKLWGNRQMSRLISFMVGRKFHDVSCGFRAYSQEAALRLNLWGQFTYTQETFLDLSVKGMRILELPIRVRGVREIGESRVAHNLWQYAFRTSEIIFDAFKDFWPLQFFGILSLLLAIPGFALFAFLGLHFLQAHRFSPHIWAGFVGGAFLGLSVICFITGLLASILKRIRLVQEELLYKLKNQELRGAGTPEHPCRDRIDA
jgi:glycosyltransferase involved in cell wall biosynthesis